MARPRKQRNLDSYTIKAIKETIKPGDTVMMRPSEKGGKSYVARIEKIERVKSQVILHVRWYYRPEESIGGRRQFHGSNEVFFSEHTDVQPVDCIEGKCIVHSFKAYTKLDSVGREDFFCRFNYNYLTGAFTPDRVAVYCKCEMPYNPDDLMVQCEGCSDWYHPTCIGMTDHEAKSLEHFYCEICSRENLQKPQHSKTPDMKGDSKRRRL